jgi:hypothetical protein
MLAWSAGVAAQFDPIDPRLRWRTLQTEHFSVHYPEQQHGEARMAAAVAEKLWPRITRVLRWEPVDRTHLVILDSADFSNGFATPIPFNLSAIFLSPPDDGELLQNREWLEMVLSHELFHIVHLDKARGAPLNLRGVFGRFPLLFPNILQPTWIIEGLAVYSETDVARGYGRLENTHFEGMMRAEVARGLRSLAELNADGRGLPLNRNYLYGSYFFAFVRERYGEHAVTAIIENYSNNIFWAPVDSNPRRATDKSTSELWPEFEDWLHARFAPKTAEASQEGAILAKAWTIFSPTLSSGGQRWYVQGDGYTLPRLMRLGQDGKPESVRQVEQDTRIAAMGDAVLLSQLEICDNYNLYYDLYRIDAGGRSRRLTDCGRNRFSAPLDDGRIVVIKVLKGGAEVVVLDASGKPLRTLYRATAGESLTGLAARGDSVVVTSLRGEQWSLVEVGGAEPVVLVSDSAIKHSPRFGSSADEVFFVADYGKVYNVWSLKRGSRSLSRWTRSLNGIRETSAPVNGELLMVSIEADGDALRLYPLPAAPLEQRHAASLAGLPESKAEPPLEASDKAYSALSTLRPRSWFPSLDLSEGKIAVGFQTFGADALLKHQYVFAPLYEFTQKEVLGFAEYLYDGRHSVILNREMVVKSQEGEDEGDIRTYSIKEQAQWVSLWRHLALNARFYWGLGAAMERERLHNTELGVTSSVQNERVVGLVAGFDSRRQQWLSEGPSQGFQLRGFAETSNGLGGDFGGNVYRGDLRGHVPLWRSVLGVRWIEGWGQSNAEPFELGGLFSDDFTLTPRLNQREFALRGYGSGEPSLIGHRARVWTVEWRMPLADIDRAAMTPPVGINRLSLNIFADIGDAWARGGSPDYHRGFGIEIMTEPSFLYLLGWQARAGVARGVDEAGKTQFYLRAGRSF